jgi:UDP-glucose 4-epimerase
VRECAGRRVLVTGGAGFVGGAVARRLAASGAEVTVFDDLSTGRADTVPEGVTLVQGSVRDAATVHDLVARHALVFHLAARGIVASTRDPREDFETNVAGTLNLLLAARECGVERIVYASSSSIYGNPRTIPINEDDALVPLSPYAVSKLSGEHYCLAFYESYGIPAAVVRYSNLYGPGQRPDNPYAGVITKFLSSAIAGQPLAVHGDGQQTRDFTFIEDAVDATLLVGTHPRAEGEVFNVGTGIETSVLELARAIADELGVDAEIEHVDRRDIDNIRRRVVNIEKIRRMLRWSPQVTLDRGLRHTVERLAAPPAHR